MFMVQQKSQIIRIKNKYLVEIQVYMFTCIFLTVEKQKNCKAPFLRENVCYNKVDARKIVRERKINNTDSK